VGFDVFVWQVLLVVQVEVPLEGLASSVPRCAGVGSEDRSWAIVPPSTPGRLSAVARVPACRLIPNQLASGSSSGISPAAIRAEVVS
jgi:hypothetical protein